MVDKTLNLRVRQSGTVQAEKQMRLLGRTTLSTIAAFTGFAGVAVTLGAVAKQIFETTKKAEGIRKAFEALNRPGLLDVLRDATRGTLSDLEIMQKTVSAKNFGIGIEQLADFFKFASIRAKETGQSVDYLVDSIVMGIGRQSPMILDNLGLSAIKIREKFKEMGDMSKAVGAIVQEQLKNMDENATNVSDSMDRVGVFWDNLVLSVSESAERVLGEAFKGMNTFLRGMEIAFKDYQKSTRNAALESVYIFSKMTDISQVPELINQLKELRQQIFDSWGDPDVVNTIKFTAEQMSFLTEEEKEQIRHAEDYVGVSQGLTNAINRIGDAAANIAPGFEEWRQAQLKLLYGEGGEEKEETLMDEYAKSIANVTASMMEFKKELKEIDKTARPGRGVDHIESTFEKLQPVANELVNTFDYVFTETLIREQNFMDSMVAGFKAMLQRMIAEFLAKAAVFGILNLITGGSYSIDSGGFWNSVNPFGSANTGGNTININAPVIDRRTIGMINDELNRYNRLH